MARLFFTMSSLLEFILSEYSDSIGIFKNWLNGVKNFSGKQFESSQGTQYLTPELLRAGLTQSCYTYCVPLSSRAIVRNIPSLAASCSSMYFLYNRSNVAQRIRFGFKT